MTESDTNVAAAFGPQSSKRDIVRHYRMTALVRQAASGRASLPPASSLTDKGLTSTARKHYPSCAASTCLICDSQLNNGVPSPIKRAKDTGERNTKSTKRTKIPQRYAKLEKLPL